jgi:hypothetical protein
MLEQKIKADVTVRVRTALLGLILSFFASKNLPVDPQVSEWIGAGIGFVIGWLYDVIAFNVKINFFQNK